MKKWLVMAGILCLSFSLCLSASASTATFQIISDPLTGTWSDFALSGDGSVMAANYGGEIYRWTAAGGFQDLGPGDPFSSAIAISKDGGTIVGGHIGSDGFASPALWNNNGVTDLGHPLNGCTALDASWGSGYGVNQDGTIAVGLAWNCTSAEGFVWTAAGGNKSLGHPGAGHSSRASAISANGKTVVGFWEETVGPRRPVRWTNGAYDLFLGATNIGEASAVTSDGAKIVGQYTGTGAYGQAFLYSDAKGLTLIGTLVKSPTDQSFANAISDDGKVVGWSGDPFGHGIEAFIWTPASGLKRMANVLQRLGANIPAGFTLTTAVSISADGSTIVGQYVDSQFNVGNWTAHITK